MKNLKRIAQRFGLLAALVALLTGAFQVQTATAGTVSCAITHTELDALNHIQLNWSCDQDISGWVTMAFGDGSQTDVYMEANTGETDHWFGFAPGYETIHTVSLIIGTQRFDYSFSIDDSPTSVTCEATVVNGETHNHKLLILECEGVTSGWATFDFGDQSSSDVWIDWAPSLGVSRGSAYHWYAYDPCKSEIHPGSITYQGVTYHLDVEISQVLWCSYLPMVANP